MALRITHIFPLQGKTAGYHHLSSFTVTNTLHLSLDLIEALSDLSRNRGLKIAFDIKRTLAESSSSSLSSSSSFEGYPLQVRHKQDWGRGFIFLLPQTAVLPGSDAGSDVIKPASSFVIQNRQNSCSMWCPMYRARC